MKLVARSLRTSSIALTLVVSMTMSSLTPGLSFAQSDTDTKEAKALFDSGVALYRTGKLEEARVKFKAAYGLKRRPSIAINLANSELQTKRPLDALGHYREVLSMADASPADKDDARNGINEARKSVGILSITPATATVTVDGEARPLTDSAVEVMPGAHTVVLRLGEVETTEKITVAAGQTVTVRAKDKASEPVAPIAAVAAAPSPSSASPAPSSAAPDLPPAPQLTSPPAAAPQNEPAPVTPSKKRRGVHTATYVGLGLTAVSAGLWITYALLAKDSADQANYYYGLLNNRGVCGEAPEGEECNTPATRTQIRASAREQESQHSDRSAIATTFGVTTAVLAVATGLSFVLLRRKSPKSHSTTSYMPTFVAAPTVGGAAFGFVGEF